MSRLNKIQIAALELIREDARFLITIIDIFKNAKNISGNYISMSLPYIGIFADGSEQWGKKIGFPIDTFSSEEKEYYNIIRSGHKLYGKSYYSLKKELQDKLKESDIHFYNIRSVLEKIIGYRNFGVDIVNEQFCGNTILCATYIPFSPFDSTSGPKIKKLSQIAGKLAGFYGSDMIPYQYSNFLRVSYKDFHYNKNSPIKIKSFDGFILFSILCSVNYAIIFIEKIFTEEIVQKFKFAYLQYYYLCDFIRDFNINTNIKIEINDSLYNPQFRNCIAHYGLGQYLEENEINENDLLRGLTIKAFNLSYIDAKGRLFNYLAELTDQIKRIIFD